MNPKEDAIVYQFTSSSERHFNFRFFINVEDVFTPSCICYHSASGLYSLGEMSFNYLLRRGDSEKLKNEGGSMVLGQVFLKQGGGTFSILFF